MKLVPAFLSDAWRGIRAGREARSSLSAPAPWLISALGGASKAGAAVTEHTAFNVSTVAACINILAQSVAALPLKVYRKTADGAEEATDHPASPLLKRKPCAGMTSYQLRAHLQACLGLGGNAYARLRRNNRFELQAIEPLRPAEVHDILRDRDSRQLFYELAGEKHPVPDYEILHLRGLSTDGLRGRSPLADLRESLGLALVAQEFAARSFANGNRKPGVLEAGPAMTRPKADEFLDFWQKHYAGAHNAGKTPFIIGGVQWKDAGFSNQDAELLGLRRFEVEEVARFYRVPLHLLNSTEKATTWGSGIEQLNRGFVDYTLTPWLVNWEQELEDKLLTEAEKAAGYYIKFNVNALLRGSPQTRADFYFKMRQMRAMTINEVRAAEELNDLPDYIGDNAREDFNGQGGGQETGAKRPALDDSAAGGGQATSGSDEE